MKRIKLKTLAKESINKALQHQEEKELRLEELANQLDKKVKAFRELLIKKGYECY